MIDNDIKLSFLLNPFLKTNCIKANIRMVLTVKTDILLNGAKERHNMIKRYGYNRSINRLKSFLNSIILTGTRIPH